MNIYEIQDIIDIVTKKFGRDASLTLLEDGSGIIGNYYCDGSSEKLIDFNSLSELSEILEE